LLTPIDCSKIPELSNVHVGIGEYEFHHPDTEPVFLKILKSPEIDFQPGGKDSWAP
jgi:hypothetical protein